MSSSQNTTQTGPSIFKLCIPKCKVYPSHREIKLAGFSISTSYEISQKVSGRVHGKGRVLVIMCVQFCVSLSPACPVPTSCPQHTVCPHDGRGWGTGSDLILAQRLHFPARCLKGSASSPQDTCPGARHTCSGSGVADGAPGLRASFGGAHQRRKAWSPEC
uniref:Uncharacterized protein n=1 Tax=Pipistrellus kuhlii TaxID=59472 RepID=A0A7J8A8Y5_PIPKU|nr:hypothetical protein mPipKuh1_008810 [Pipistrellus kuhlii]